MGDPLSESTCLFCRIAQGEIPAELISSDPDVVAFRDINPQAPTHILIIPRRHIASVDNLTESDAEVMGKLFLVAKALACKEGISEGGYRMVVNAGPDAGQTVFHVHLHLLGGGVWVGLPDEPGGRAGAPGQPSAIREADALVDRLSRAR